MNKKLKFFLVSCLLLTVALLATACNGDNSPYEQLSKDGYTVSVKYDANGGTFTTNTSTIIDTYDLSTYQTNSEGNKEIPLFAPNDEKRGNQSYTAEKVGYYLAGWYTQRDEAGEVNGEKAYTYSGFWDFENEKLALDANKKYTANEPVITLYAAWVPAMQYEFYSFDENGNAVSIGNIEVDPTKGISTLITPSFNPETGKIGDNNDFPGLSGQTYGKIYADADKKTEITDSSITHTGKFIKETATLEAPVMKIYCEVLDGLYFEVDSPEKITKNSYLNANYILKNDIDFEGKAWPATFLSKNFEGSIIGNGYSIKNITINQNDSSAANFGLFGQLTGSAKLENVTFDGITLKINAGARVTAPSFGILAGTIATDAEITDVVIKNSQIIITRKANLNITTNPTIGIVSGAGDISGITFSENNTVSFADDGNMEYTYEMDDTGRFHLEKK